MERRGGEGGHRDINLLRNFLAGFHKNQIIIKVSIERFSHTPPLPPHAILHFAVHYSRKKNSSLKKKNKHFNFLMKNDRINAKKSERRKGKKKKKRRENPEEGNFYCSLHAQLQLRLEWMWVSFLYSPKKKKKKQKKDFKNYVLRLIARHFDFFKFPLNSVLVSSIPLLSQTNDFPLLNISVNTQLMRVG